MPSRTELHSPAPRRVSLRDVARETGVTHVAVSLALRGDARVGAAKREEIRAAAERLGYRPDPMLSALAGYRRTKSAVPISATVAWINQWSNPHALRSYREFDLYWQGAAETAAQLGYRLEEFAVGRDLTAERLQKILTARGVRGLILPPHPDGLAFARFDWSQYSAVRLGLSLPEPRVHAVVSDQSECAVLAYARVHGHGYRRIGFISSPRFDRNTRGNFRAGYLRHQSDHAAPRACLPPLLLEEDTTAATLARLRDWLDRARPEAVIATHSLLSALLDRLGIRVPRDLAVATTSVLDGKFPAGIDQNCREIGAVALRTLASFIHQNERGLPQTFRRILVEGKWIEGATLPPKAR